MKRWRRVALIAGLLIAVTVGGLFEASTRVVRGRLCGEAFYDGRPTSWWRGELMHWNAVRVTRTGLHWTYQRDESWFDRMMQTWRSEDDIYEWKRNLRNGPRIGNNSEAAQPVLRELLNDSSPHIRRTARFALRMDSE